MRATIAILVVFAAVAISSASDDLPPILESVKPAVVAIEVEHNESTSRATGFLIGDGLLLTSYDAIQSARRASFTTDSGHVHDILGIIAANAKSDLAVLSVDWPDHPPPLALAQSSPRPGEMVFVLSTPRGLELTVTDGIIAGLRGSLLQITAPVSPENSGGPVLNHSGKVVGVVTFSILAGQDLNFAVSSRLVQKLQHHEPRPLDRNTPAYTRPRPLPRPGAPRPSPPDDILERLTPNHRTWITERAPDHLIFPDGLIVDAYRLNRWAELRTNRSHRQTRGVDHLDHLLHADDAPPFLHAISGEKVPPWQIHIDGQCIDIEDDTIHPQPGKLHIKDLLSQNELVASRPEGELAHILGPFEQGTLNTGDSLHGRFFLEPLGTFTHTTADGETLAIPSFQFWRFEWLEMSPACLAHAIDHNQLILTRHRIDVTPRRTVIIPDGNQGIGGRHQRTSIGGRIAWRTEPIHIEFIPDPASQRSDLDDTIR